MTTNVIIVPSKEYLFGTVIIIEMESEDKMIELEKVLTVLMSRRKCFVSEADFQLELAWHIKEIYPNCMVRCEYVPSFDKNMHIDILVIKDDKWYPIELKYKTSACVINIGNEQYNLKNHGAKDQSCNKYLADIQRIEKIKASINNFGRGFTVFLTNDLSFAKKPQKDNCVYKQFSIHEGAEKQGKLEWGMDASEGTRRGCTDILLSGKYNCKWKIYSKISDCKNGEFIYLLNEID